LLSEERGGGGVYSLALGRAAALPRPIGRSASETKMDIEVEDGDKVERSIAMGEMRWIFQFDMIIES
jgi:hypothetical protein